MKNIIILLICLSAFLQAGNYEEAGNSFKNKDYKKAYNYLEKAYKENDKRALYSLVYLLYITEY